MSAGVGSEPADTRVGGEDARRGGAQEHSAMPTRGRTPTVRRAEPGSVHCLVPPKDGAGNGGVWSRGRRRRRGDQPPTWVWERVEG